MMLGLFGLLFMMFAYNFFFGENGYRRQKQEAFKIEYGEKWMQDSADELKSKAFIFWDKTDRLIQNDTLKDYRKEKLTDMEIKLNKTYPAKGKPSEKEFEEWKEEHSERRWLTLPGMS